MSLGGFVFVTVFAESQFLSGNHLNTWKHNV